MPNTNLYVGNIPWGTTEEALKAYFEQYGAIKGGKIIVNHKTGQSRGFGFIEFVDEESAEKALVENGCDFDGRTLRVRLANQQHYNNRPGVVNLDVNDDLMIPKQQQKSRKSRVVYDDDVE